MKNIFFPKLCCLLFAACAFFACDVPNKELDGDGNDNGNTDSSGEVEMVTFTKNQPDEDALFGIVVDSQNAISGSGNGFWQFAAIEGNGNLKDVKDIPESLEDYEWQVEAVEGAIYVGMMKIDDGRFNFGYDYIAIQVMKVTETTATIKYIYPFYTEPLNASDLINFDTDIIGNEPGDELVINLNRIVPYRLSIAEHPDWSMLIEFGQKTIKFTNHHIYMFEQEARYLEVLFTSGSFDYLFTIKQQPDPYLFFDWSEGSSGKAGSHATFIYSNAAWTATCEESWCTLLTTSGSGDGEIRYELAANADGRFREATIWLTVEGIADPQPLAVSQRAWFKSGQGSEADPYIISNISELYAVTDAGSDYFLMVNDIDVSPFIYEESGGWTPIYLGSGHFDGGNHTLSGIWWNRPDNGQAGSFNVAENAVISNLHIKLDSRGIISGDFTGGFVGFTRTRVTITNCSLTGNIKGGTDTGGIVGGAPYQFINLYDCTVNGNIQGLHMVGGIAGTACGDIKGCYFDGTVKATEGAAGGILGFASGYPGLSHNTDMNECASKGQIEGSTIAGGLIGYTYTPFSLHIFNSYSHCSLKVTGNSDECYVGGLIGQKTGKYWWVANSYFAGSISAGTACIKGGIMCNGSPLNLTNSYFDKEASGVDEAIPGWSNGALTTAQMKNQSSYSEWDFSEIWVMNGSDYPTLRRVNERLRQ